MNQTKSINGQRISAGLIEFGQWVIVDNNPEDQRQVVDFDILNDKYMLDKNGVWGWFETNRIKKL